MSAKELFAKASPAVVRVVAYGKDGKPVALGSGAFVSADGKVVTNHHVIKDAKAVNVVLSTNASLRVHKILAQDIAADLALLQTTGQKVAFLPLAKVVPAIGTRVYAIGNPQGLTNTISEGIISGVRKLKEIDFIQTTAPISKGSSGGPLLTTAGEIIGVTTFMHTGGQNLNFASPLDRIRRLLSGKGSERLLGNTPVPHKPPAQVKTYPSVAAVARDAPKGTVTNLPLGSISEDAGRVMSRKLLDKWIKEELIGHKLRLQSVTWDKPEVKEPRSSSDTLRIRAYCKERFSGYTLYITVYGFFEAYTRPDRVSKAKSLLSRRPGSRVSIDGRIEGAHFSEGSGSIRLCAKYGVTRGSTTVEIRPNHYGSRVPEFTDRRGVNVYIWLDDWNVPAAPARRTVDKPVLPKPKPPRELTPEEQAKGKLSIAQSYHQAGLKDKARKILESILADYPETPAAKKAKEELKRLE